ncbi:hypothetical protein HPB51_010690 [Rhipicephalus microplus]|uniref:Uncharacterized protein n=1 Tax=Rhipicephalus microplus TaxID=6941 RepID=A0A9J6DTT9_RHIMP|nr:hypothetical protein HPB51_010690 [Rhipicephalus microplus]
MNHLLKELNLLSNCSRRSWYLRFVYDRKPAARTSAPGRSHSGHFNRYCSQAQDGDETEAEASFGFESTSRGPDNKPSTMETDLLELFVHFRMQQESHHGKRHSTEVRITRRGLDSKCHSKDKKTTASRTMSNSNSKRPGAGKFIISSSKLAEEEDEFKGDEVFDHETGRSKLTKQGAVDIMTQLRDFLRVNSPSEEHDLRKGSGISQVQMILDMHVKITAFSDRSPLFEVIYEHL